MSHRSIDDLDPKGRVVFCRVDFNVPLDGSEIANDRRIKAALPTLEALSKKGARVLCASHLGRPKGEHKPELSLGPVARHLGQLLGREVRFAADCVGDPAKELAESLGEGDVGVLENVRFHAGETKNDAEFARALAAPADLFVNDAFGSSHRAHASVVGVPEVLGGGYAGYLMDKEMKALGRIVEKPERPYVAILGGAKVSDKIQLIEQLLERVDTILVGGAMAYTFLKAQGVEVGSSLVEEEHLDLAKRLSEAASQKGVKLLLPVDHYAAREIGKRSVEGVQMVESVPIPGDLAGVDIGPKTLDIFRGALSAEVRTVLWNGPLGLFEADEAARGTREIAQHLAGMDETFRVLGGGDTAAAAEVFGLEDRYDHVSTGGGAALEFLSGDTLPGVAALEE